GGWVAVGVAARAILDAAIAAGDAYELTRRALRVEEADGGWRLSVGQRTFDLDRVRRLIVVGAGKASGRMAEAVADAIGDPFADSLVVVEEARECAAQVGGVEAGPPIPDERGRAAAGEILRLVTSAGADDLVICLISGGGSALMPLPVPGVTLAEKQTVTRL